MQEHLLRWVLVLKKVWYDLVLLLLLFCNQFFEALFFYTFFSFLIIAKDIVIHYVPIAHTFCKEWNIVPACWCVSCFGTIPWLRKHAVIVCRAYKVPNSMIVLERKYDFTSFYSSSFLWYLVCYHCVSHIVKQNITKHLYAE